MIPNMQTENYNETVLIPILQDRIVSLTNQTILLEAKLRISEKQREEAVKNSNTVTASEVLQPANSDE